MRFAGTRIEGFLGDSPEYDALASGASKLASKERQAITDIMGKTAAAGVSAASKVKAAELAGAAQQQMASAQGQSAMMGMIGQIGGSAISAMGPANISSYADIPAEGLRGLKAGGGFSNPNAYMGQGGKYGSFVPPTQNANGYFSFK